MNPIKIIQAIIAVIVIGISISYFSFESNVTDIQNNNNLEELGSLEESVNNKLIETTIIDEFGQESKLIIRLTDKIIKSENDGSYSVIEAFVRDESGDASKIYLHMTGDLDDKQIKYIEILNDAIFRQLFNPNDLINYQGTLVPSKATFELKDDMGQRLDQITVSDADTSLVIIPTFTASAYSEPGFYTFYLGQCDGEFHGMLFRDEDCLTVEIISDDNLDYNSSGNAVQILDLLNYDMITYLELHHNPNILTTYDKIILLHNEYVSNVMFNAITSHENVIFLYPNALYAEVDVNVIDNTITLVRGHNYPDITIRNGFDWQYDNTHPYEYDNECKNWEFYSIPNGHMLNCFPENIIWTDELLLKALKDL